MFEYTEEQIICNKTTLKWLDLLLQKMNEPRPPGARKADIVKLVLAVWKNKLLQHNGADIPIDVNVFYETLKILVDIKTAVNPYGHAAHTRTFAMISQRVVNHVEKLLNSLSPPKQIKSH
jgi:hypothetical protein